MAPFNHEIGYVTDVHDEICCVLGTKHAKVEVVVLGNLT